MAALYHASARHGLWKVRWRAVALLGHGGGLVLEVVSARAEGWLRDTLDGFTLMLWRVQMTSRLFALNLRASSR